MKILQLVTKRQFRGAEVFAANLSKELINENIQVVFAGLYSSPEVALSVDGAANVDLQGKESRLLSIGLLQSLVQLIRKEKPDIIQANGSDTLKYAVAIKLWMPNIPVTYRNISIISTWIGSSRLKRTLYKGLFAHIDHVTCVGQAARKDFLNTIGFPVDSITVINRGIPIQEVDKYFARKAVRAKYNLNDSDRIVVHVGNFSREKNHSFLLDVFNILQQADSSIKLLLFGKGVLEEEIRNEIDKKKLNGTVFLGGFSSNIQEVIAGCDLFALCSTVEGVPGVILEAAAQKVAAVAVDVGGVGEVVVQGKTGTLLPNHNVDSFAQAIKIVLKDDELRKQLENNAYELVRSQYDPKFNLVKFVEVYNRLLRRNGK